MAAGIVAFNKRIINRNPVEPYSWRVQYKDGGRLKQFDFDGYHHSREIDLQRIGSLVINGHPDSPIELHLPTTERQPDEVIIKATCDLSFETEIGTGEVVHSRQASYFFGFRYGNEKYLVLIDPQGRIFKTNSDQVNG